MVALGLGHLAAPQGSESLRKLAAEPQAWARCLADPRACCQGWSHMALGASQLLHLEAAFLWGDLVLHTRQPGLQMKGKPGWRQSRQSFLRWSRSPRSSLLEGHNRLELGRTFARLPLLPPQLDRQAAANPADSSQNRWVVVSC